MLTMTGELVPLVNRLRSKGYSYERVKEMLVKLGNAPQAAQDAIDEYVKEMCGVSAEQSISSP